MRRFKITPEMKVEIKRLRATGKTQREIAVMYNVSITAIQYALETEKFKGWLKTYRDKNRDKIIAKYNEYRRDNLEKVLQNRRKVEYAAVAEEVERLMKVNLHLSK